MVVTTIYSPPTNDFTITPLDATKPAGTSGVTAYTFTVTRTSDPSQPDSGTYIVGGTSSAPATANDFQGGVFPSGTFSFAPGETTTTITIYVAGDPNPEPDEQFVVSVGGGKFVPNIPFGTNSATAIGTIQNNGTPIATVFSILADPARADLVNGVYAGPSQYEGTPDVQGDFSYSIGRPYYATNGDGYVFTVTREGDLSQTQTVNWAVAGTGANPATAGSFFGGVLPSGTLTFAPGSGIITITIDTRPNFTPGPDLNFTVSLSNPSGGAGLDVSNANATILNDDVPTNIGTTGNDTINLAGSTDNLFIDVSQGGNDAVTGGTGNDIFYFGAAFTAADTVSGGGGSDTLVLDGDYAAGVSFGANTLTNVQNIYLARGNSYNLTLNNTTAPPPRRPDRHCLSMPIRRGRPMASASTAPRCSAIWCSWVDKATALSSAALAVPASLAARAMIC